MILYAEIDGKYYAEIVTPVAGTIKAKNIKDVTVTTTDDTVYEDSYVANNTVDKDDEILNMDQQVEYQLYLDKFGHIAAYDLDGSRYALLTEMYPSRNFNGQYVTDGTWIAEVMTGSDVAPQEYDVLNSYVNRNVTNPFIGAAWTSATHHVFNNSTSWIANRLQPATARLDRETRYTPVRAPFDYDSTNNILYTNTNVAKFTKSEDGVNLYTAAEFQTKNGDQLYYADLYNGGNLSQTGDGIYEKYTESEFRATFQKVWNATAQDADMDDLRKLPVYDTDYIQLAVGAVKAGTEHFTASVYPYNQAAEGTAAAQYATSYINAVDSTEFYVVGPYSIQHYVGYKNLPAIAAKDVETMYAVAQNVDRANDGRDYWVADVIVIEVNNQYWYDRVDTVFEANNATSRNTLALKNGNLYLDVIDSKDTAVNSLVPDYSTWNSAYDRGFYGVADSENIDTNTIAGTVERLGPATVLVTNPNSAQWNSYNDAGVHAGVVTRSAYIMNNSVYIDVDGKAVEIGYNTAMIIGRSNSASRWNAESTGYTNLLAGHRVIYVKTGSGTVDYVLDLTYTKSSSWTNAGSSWLATEYSNIVKEQGERTSGKITIKHTGTFDFTTYLQNEKVVNLPNMANDSLMADYTIGNEICIPVSLFEISTVSALNGLVEFDAANSGYVTGTDVNGEVITPLVHGVRNNTLCYIFPANIDTLALRVVYNYAAGKTLDDVLDTVVALTDNTGKTDEGGSVVVGDSSIETVTTMPDVTTLARATDAYVKVSFNLENGYYNPSVKLGSTNLKVFTAADGTWAPAEGYAYAVYFKLGVSNVLVITAVNNANPIYTVALDTSVANISFDSKTSDIYRVNSDTKVTFTVRTNGDYNVDLDTAPYATVAISDPTVVGSGSTAVQTWTITVTKVTANTKVVLKATPKIN